MIVKTNREAKHKVVLVGTLSIVVSILFQPNHLVKDVVAESDKEYCVVVQEAENSIEPEQVIPTLPSLNAVAMGLSESLISRDAEAEADVEDETVEEIVNNTIFSNLSISLNKDIYEESVSVFNEEHFNTCYADASTNLAISYGETVTPLMPLAISIIETGAWADTRYTWTPAIYSQALNDAGIDLSNIDIAYVDSNLYLVNGLSQYIACGNNCSGSSKHYHCTGGLNDLDSLGPTQILRRYVETNGFISYPCGETCSDLMSWHDNLEYIFHNQSDHFTRSLNWNAEYTIRDSYECMAIMAAVHNSGCGFMVTGTAQSSYMGWKNSKAVFDLARDITNPDMMNVMTQWIDTWYDTEVIPKLEQDKEFVLPSQCDLGLVDSMLSTAGLIKSNYASNWGIKQYYPILAVLNYLALERLYNEIL